MPLHLAELKKITVQNDQIIELLTKLITIQQPKSVVSNTPKEGVKKNVTSRKSKSTSARKRVTNSNAVK